MHLENSMVLYGVYNTETLENHIQQCIASTILLKKLKNSLQDNLTLPIHGILMCQVPKLCNKLIIVFKKYKR